MKKPPIHRSFYYAFRGLLTMLQSERNFQIEVGALLINVFLIFYLGLTKEHSAIILLTCSLVLLTEILNTAIEKICDFIQPEYDGKIGFIKDISAGAVFLASAVAVVVGVLIYYPYFFS